MCLSQRASFLCLPNELYVSIFQQLSLVDAFHLGRTCRRFHDVLHDNNLCRFLLQTNAPFSEECLEASSTNLYIPAFRQLVLKRLAVGQLEPYAVAVLAIADSYLYVRGTLLYIVNRTLRIVTLRGSVREELVIDIRRLLDDAIAESKGTVRYKFMLLDYADGIVACRYTHCIDRNESWLLVFHVGGGRAPRSRIKTRDLQDSLRGENADSGDSSQWSHIDPTWQASVRVASPLRLFARIGRAYIIYGTHTGGLDEDGNRRWVIWRFSLRHRRVIGKSRSLPGIVGSEVGQDVCFAIFDEYFYALSDAVGSTGAGGWGAEAAAVGASTGWLNGGNAADGPSDHGGHYFAEIQDAYYFACRFSLDDMDHLEVATRTSRWRRLHCEGTIDDSWSARQLALDEQTGTVLAVETRKEWRRVGGSLYGGSELSTHTRRSSYAQELLFRDGGSKQARVSASVGGMIGTNQTSVNAGTGDQDAMIGLGHLDDTLENDGHEWRHISSSDEKDHLTLHAGPNSQQPMSYSSYSGSSSSNVDNTAAMESCRWSRRRPEHIHPSDDSSDTTVPLILPSTCPVRGYLFNCASFVDLVDFSPRSASRRDLRLRGTWKRPRPIDDAKDHSRGMSANEDPLYPLGEIERLYHISAATTWPPEGSHGEKKESRLDALAARTNAALNPPGHNGCISGTWDDRSLVYAVETTGAIDPTVITAEGVAKKKTQKQTFALVLITFDPNLKLPHLQTRPWESTETLLAKADEKEDDWGSASERRAKRRKLSDARHSETKPNLDVQHLQARHSVFTATDAELAPTELEEDHWLRVTDSPMYKSIDLGVELPHGLT